MSPSRRFFSSGGSPDSSLPPTSFIISLSLSLPLSPSGISLSSESSCRCWWWSCCNCGCSCCCGGYTETRERAFSLISLKVVYRWEKEKERERERERFFLGCFGCVFQWIFLRSTVMVMRCPLSLSLYSLSSQHSLISWDHSCPLFLSLFSLANTLSFLGDHSCPLPLFLCMTFFGGWLLSSLYISSKTNPTRPSTYTNMWMVTFSFSLLSPSLIHLTTL